MAKDFAPWSAETAQGIKTDPVDSNIKVRQEVVPAVNVGTISTVTGEWVGVPTSDEIFSSVTTAVQIGNTELFLAPDTGQENRINMTGYQDLFIALRPTRAGNVKIDAVMGPASNSFGNLTPVNAADRIQIAGRFDVPASLQSAFYDNSQDLTADVWNIYLLQGVLSNQKNLNFRITNDSGGLSTIEFAYMRIV